MNTHSPAPRFLVLLLLALPFAKVEAQIGSIAPGDIHHGHAYAPPASSQLPALPVIPGDERWDNRFGYPGINGPVYAIEVSGDQIYIGGSFDYAQNVAARNIVRFDTRTGTFSAMGAGTNYHVHSIEATSNGDVYIGGEFTLIGEETARGLARWDGSGWHAVGTGISGGVGHFGSCVWDIREVGDLIYFGGDFDTINGRNINGLVAWNRATDSWSQLGDGTDGIVYALDTLGGDLYAGGTLRRAGLLFVGNIARWNGSDWSILGEGIANGVDGAVESLKSADGSLYVGGRFQNANGDTARMIARWDGSRWSALGNGFFGGWGSWGPSVFDIQVRNGVVFAGGAFSSHGNLARWDGAEWKKIGQEPVFALGLHDSTLLAGGIFKNQSCRYFARWRIPSESWQCFAGAPIGVNTGAIAALDDTMFIGRNGVEVWNAVTNQWSRLDGLEGRVTSFAIDAGHLYAAGSLMRQNSTSRISIARWSFASRRWEILHQDPDVWARINTITIRDSILYAGNVATAEGSRISHGVDLLDLRTRTWSNLGESLADVRALAFLGNDLVAGGEFGATNGLPRNIARWDGARWTSLGAGLPGVVTALAVSSNRLYASGTFDTIGFTVVHRLAVWENNEWSGLNGGAYTVGGDFYNVDDIVADGDDLYVAGSFDRAGLTEVSNIARWNHPTRTWSPLGSGIEGSPRTLALSGTSLFVRGYFQKAGGKVSLDLARWKIDRVTAVRAVSPSRHGAMLATRTEGNLTIVDLTLPERSHTTLELFDRLGRRAAVINVSVLESGRHSIPLDTRNLSPGFYFVTLSTQRGVETAMILVER